MMAVFRSLAFAERTNPDVVRLTANVSKSGVRVAILCNDALFVLVLLFMIFSSRAPRESRVRFKPETGRSHFSGRPAATLCRNALADSGATAIFAGEPTLNPHSKAFP